MRDPRHDAHQLSLRAGMALAAACLASACAFAPLAGVPSLLANRDAECDIGPSWNETPMWDSGEVRLIWRYHPEQAWQGVCETSAWGCIHCNWEAGERVCTVDLRIRPRFSQLCHMAVLGHELGHALGKMHEEPRVRVIPVSFMPAQSPPARGPEPVPVPPIVDASADEPAVVALALETLPEVEAPRLDAMLERAKPIVVEPVTAAWGSGRLAVHLDPARLRVLAPLP